MEKKADGFDQFSVQQAMKLAQSDAGKQLFALLQSTNGTKLQSAMDSAASGDYTQAIQAMREMMGSAQVQALMEKMREG